MNTVFALVAGYFGLLVVLSLIARPSRLRLAELGRELACEDIKPEHRQFLKALLESSYSMRSAPAHLASLTIVLLTPSEKFDSSAREWVKDNRELVDDPRWNKLFDYHIVSIVAANPIFGGLLLVARLLFRLKARLFAKRRHGSPAVDPRALEMFGELKAA